MLKTYDPTWKNHDVTTIKGAQAFAEEREKEMATNPQAKEWEQSRRRSLNSQKHAYVLKEKQAEKAELQSIVDELKDGGQFDQDLTPLHGFILIRPDAHKNQTDTGLTLPDSVNPSPNTGVVVACGGQDLEVGMKVLYKRGAGLEVVIKQEVLLLMRCVEDVQITDILGVFR